MGKKKETKKNRTWTIIGFIIIVLVIAACVVAALMLLKKPFTITFDSNGGSEVSSIKVECGKELPSLPVPTKKGYRFLSWVDRNEMPIYSGALLTCDDITLKANWEKGTSKGSGGKTVEPKLPDVPEKSEGKTYKCPDGYELNNTNRCVRRLTASTSCPSGYKYSSNLNLCYNDSETTPYKRVCKNETVNGKSVNGDLLHVRGATYYCGYEEVTRFANDERSCEHSNYIYSSVNGKCYTKYIQNNYETVCPSGYYDAKSNSLDGSNNQMCVKTKKVEYSCPKAFALEDGICYSFVNPTVE